MNYYVYTTEQCTEDAQKYGFADDIKKLQDKLESDQTTIGLRRFPKPFLAKRLGRKGRLVIEEHFVDDDCILCFVKLFDRGDSAYENNFLANPQRFYEDYTPSEDVLLSYLQERRKASPPPSYPSLSVFEQNYLYSLDATTYQDDGFILESQDWITGMNQPEVVNFTSAYWELLFKVIDQNTDPKCTIVIHPNYSNRAILYRYFPEYHKWFLVALVDPSDNQTQEKLRERYHSIFCESETITEDILIRLSRRSYPALIVYDPEIWIQKTQKSVDANLALSGEEIRVLDSILMSEDRLAYPLFINGRPGSGKSTLLQYLFAEHLHQYFKLTERTSPPPTLSPMYLTYSEELLAQAKETIRNILVCDSKKVLDDSHYLDSLDIWERFERSFGYFREYLFQLMPEDERRHLDKDKYIDFPKFKYLWSKQFSRSADKDIRHLSSELGWHVIRTYIKGMRQDITDFFDFESYKDELPKKQKTVTDGTFKIIFEKIWKKWYKPLCQTERYWDDQDLTRRLLDSGMDLSRHLVVFCDEAQDFTKVELELILSLSVYSKRQIYPLDLPRVPFAFAGDPFQTLNPTGFDWDSTQASFHENIVERLDKDKKANLAFNFQELTFNYRSTENIVRLCNLIQLLRGIAFGIKNLCPQENWFLEASVIPVYFEDKQSTCRSFLREHQEVVIIVPCQEGEELAYIESDPFLKEIALGSESQIIRNIHSPIRVKGLEFSRVVLYKFGQECLDHYPKLLDCLDSANSMMLDKEESLPLEYFVNRFYVAASRAQKRLFIVDTKDGLERFWKYASSAEYKRLLELYEHDDIWKTEHLISIRRGSRDDWVSDADRDNPRELGEKYLQWGRSHQDTELLQIARRNFQVIQDIEKSDSCLALIREYQEDWKGAGDIYASLNYVNEAKRCYWQGQALSSILRLVEREANIVNSLEYQVASFIYGERSRTECIQFLKSIYKAIQEKPQLKVQIPTDRLWISSVDVLVKSLSVSHTCASSLSVEEDWTSIYSQLEYILGSRLRILESQELAHLAYLAGKHKEAVRIWGKPTTLEEKEYPDWIVDAMAKAKPYPQNLKWLSKLGDDRQIYRAYIKNQDVQLDGQNDQNIVLDTLFNVGQTPEILKLASSYPNTVRYAKLIDRLIEIEQYTEILEAKDGLLRYLVNKGRWEEAINFVSSGELRVPHNLRKQILDYGWDYEHLHIDLIKLLSNSERLANELGGDKQRMVSDYLNEHLQTRNLALRREISLEEAGAAIERTNVVVPALAFYEFVMRNGWAGSGEEEIQFARERWVKCKYRQANVTRGRERQRRIREDADNRARQWRIDSSEFPAYPVITASLEGSLDPAGLLSKLADLHKAGVLEDDEFEEKRQKILSRQRSRPPSA